MSNTPATYQDADLLLKLYDLRREPVMREARVFCVQFMPQSVDEILAIMRTWGSKEGAYIRQVSGYWEMVASLVNHGALNESLVYENCGELYLLYAKFQPFLASFRESMNSPEFLKNVETLVEASAAGRARVERMQGQFKDWLKRRDEAAAKKSSVS
ncbi:MAG TPA: hypothetical protein VMU45_05675 [Candidatus Eisenbacteria bacterium]|nr:hypothetical protein [Candidatus Eisenbacteria bacterium]